MSCDEFCAYCFDYGVDHDEWLHVSSPPTEPAPVDDHCDIVVEKLPAPPRVPGEMRDTRPPPKRADRVRGLGPCYFCDRPAGEKLANGCPICAQCKKQNEDRKPRAA